MEQKSVKKVRQPFAIASIPAQYTNNGNETNEQNF